MDRLTILRDKIIVTQTEDEEFAILPLFPIDRHHGDAFPFLIQQTGVLRSAIVEAEFR